MLIEYYYCHIVNAVLGSTQSRSHEQQPHRLRRVQVDIENAASRRRERSSMLDDGFSSHNSDVRPSRSRAGFLDRLERFTERRGFRNRVASAASDRGRLTARELNFCLDLRDEIGALCQEDVKDPVAPQIFVRKLFERL